MPQLVMPNVGEGVTEGTVTRWLKHEGDAVALDEPIVEVETDKAVVEIPSPVAGTLSKILVQEGEVVPIDAPLAEFDGASAGAEPQGEPAAAPAAEAKQPGAAEGQAAAEKQPVAAQPAAAPQRTATANGASNGTREHRLRQYSPVVMKLAEENGIDLTLVRGTGIEGRVTRKDVMRYIENPSANTAPPPSTSGVVGFSKPQSQQTPPNANVAQPAPAASDDRPNVAQPPKPAPTGIATTPLSATRKTIARRMSESHATIPVAWMVVEADVTGLVELREHIKEDFARTEGVKLTYLPFFVQSIVAALKSNPALNATFDDAGITQHRRYDIGIAMATEHGLVVPVIRNAGDLSIAGLARAIDALAAKAQARKLTVQDMQDATFTVDNTGAFGSIVSQPIVPVGQAAIITTEAIRREIRPLEGGAFAARSVMNLCISFDHRALDGAEVGAFMRDVRLGVEAYRRDQPTY